MKLDLYTDQDGEKLRLGYTTGSTATAAAKAALYTLLNQEKIDYIQIETPADVDLKLPVSSLVFDEHMAMASVIKDGGDDIDATDGIEIFARVSPRKDKEINIIGGEGVGKITKKGLYGDIGDPAINPTPRKTIKKEMRKLSSKGYDVEIIVPQGKEISKKTFNQNIGIVDGISIIGTKGLVYPKSVDAYLKTIYIEIDTIKTNYETKEPLVLTLGNYGEDWTRENTDYQHIIQVSNYIGKALKYAYKAGFRKFMLIGHIGKFSKLSLGIFNTHNETADTRMEALVYYMAMRDLPHEDLVEISNFLTAEEAGEYLVEKDYGFIIKDMEEGINSRVKSYLKDRDIDVKSLIYSFKRGVNFEK